MLDPLSCTNFEELANQCGQPAAWGENQRQQLSPFEMLRRFEVVHEEPPVPKVIETRVFANTDAWQIAPPLELRMES